MNQAKINELVAEFFELAAIEPEKHAALFQAKIKHMPMDEIWEVMFTIANQVREDVQELKKNSVAIAA
jgi:hypothetical protein